MKYKIGEFCRLLGVSPDTLRYYERCNLLSTDKNPENKYRLFNKRDALDIWSLHMLRSLDMSLRDIETLRRQGSIEAQKNYLHEREKALAHEIQKLAIKRERLIQLSKLYDLVHKVNEVICQENMASNYALLLLGEDCRIDKNMLDEIPDWVSCLPFTYFAVDISYNSLLSAGDGLSISLGVGILEENVEKAGLKLGPHALYTPQNTRVATTLCTNDLFGLTKKDIAPVFSYIEENKLRITGPASGRIICSTCHADDPAYIVALGIPVEKLTNTP